MRVSVKAHPKSRQDKVVRIDEGHLEVWVSEPPDKGKATEAVRVAVAGYLKVAKSRVALVSGAASRNKVFEIV